MLESQEVRDWIEKRAVKERRELVLRALNNRFPGVVPAEVAKLINEQESLDLLGHWFDAALDAQAFDDFLALKW